MSDVILVLGMHRSGTSAVAGVLTKLGGAAPTTLMPADYGNAQGYFESRAFMQFHDELLASGGSSWQDWQLFNPGFYRSSTAVVYRRRAKELFASEFADSDEVAGSYRYYFAIDSEMISPGQRGLPAGYFLAFRIKPVNLSELVSGAFDACFRQQGRCGVYCERGDPRWRRHKLDRR